MSTLNDDRPVCSAPCPGMIGPHVWQRGHCTAPYPTEARKGALYVSPDGAAYRVQRRYDRLYEKWQEEYAVLTVDGYSGVRYQLPAGSRLVWEPPAESTTAGKDESQPERGEVPALT